MNENGITTLFNVCLENDRKYFKKYYEYLQQLKNLSFRNYLYQQSYLDDFMFKIDNIDIDMWTCDNCNTSFSTLYFRGFIKPCHTNNRVFRYTAHLHPSSFWKCKCFFSKNIFPNKPSINIHFSVNDDEDDDLNYFINDDNFSIKQTEKNSY